MQEYVCYARLNKLDENYLHLFPFDAKKRVCMRNALFDAFMTNA